MVVHDFYIFSVTIHPAEAHSKLVVDPDTVLSRAIAPESLQSIAGRNLQELQRARGMKGEIFHALDMQKPQTRKDFSLRSTMTFIQSFLSGFVVHDRSRHAGNLWPQRFFDDHRFNPLGKLDDQTGIAPFRFLELYLFDFLGGRIL